MKVCGVVLYKNVVRQSSWILAPLVNGYFVVPTESTSQSRGARVIIDRESRASVFNDSGCPHTLEQ